MWLLPVIFFFVTVILAEVSIYRHLMDREYSKVSAKSYHICPNFSGRHIRSSNTSLNETQQNAASYMSLQWCRSAIPFSHIDRLLSGLKGKNGKELKKKQKKVREKSRECHNHKPQPFPDPKRKRKPTNLNKHKPNKCTKSTKMSKLS